MSSADPVATLLADLDRPAAPRVEFVDELGRRLRRELDAPRSDGFAITYRLARRPRLRLVLVVLAWFVVLAGIATATYFLVHASRTHEPRAGALTFFVRQKPAGGLDTAAAIVSIEPDGSRQTVWRCPNKQFCGDPTSVAWSHDGRRVAITLVEYGARSPYPALHIIDPAARTDRSILPRVPQHAPGEPLKVYKARVDAAARPFGCFIPETVAWSPDGKRLAYACGEYEIDGTGNSNPSVWLVNADGSSPRRLRTGTVGAAWPSWSPDGRRIAFSTSDAPEQGSRIYVIDVDGTHRHLVANGVGPVWSPRGDVIAYRSSCGVVRLVTPTGKDATHGATNGCPGIGPPGWPVWSPDGRTIAIATDRGHGLYEVRSDGTDLRQITSTSILAVAHAVIRPAWRPEPARSGQSRTTKEPNL